MAEVVREYYHPQVVAANSVTSIGTRIHGMLATAAGSVSVSSLSSGTFFINTLPVVVGYNQFPIEIGTQSLVVTLAGGAAGTLLT